MTERRLHLRWFRDYGRGQEAAEATGAEQVMDGSWPTAILFCQDHQDADTQWERLYNTYGVNAMRYAHI